MLLLRCEKKIIGNENKKREKEEEGRGKISPGCVRMSFVSNSNCCPVFPLSLQCYKNNKMSGRVRYVCTLCFSRLDARKNLVLVASPCDNSRYLVHNF